MNTKITELIRDANQTITPADRHAILDLIDAQASRIAASLPPAAPAQSGEAGYALRCDGKLWVVTDPEVAAKWKAQGFEVTPVAAPQPAQTEQSDAK